MSTYEDEKEREKDEWIQGLRDMADFFEARRDAMPAYLPRFSFYKAVMTQKDLGEQARKFRTNFVKKADDYSYELVHNFGPHSLSLSLSRTVACEKVQIGTERVTVPDPAFKPPMVEIEQPIYEWRCPESVLRGDEEAREETPE